MRDQVSKSETGEVVAKDETSVSSLPTEVEVPKARRESGADKLQQAVEQAYQAYLRMAESVWKLGEALIHCEQVYNQVHGQWPTLRQLAALLGLPLSEQRIGQILNTTKAVPEEYRDNNLDFKRFQVAVQANNTRRAGYRFSPDQLRTVVAKYDAKNIPAIVKDAKEPKALAAAEPKQRELAFRVSSSSNVVGKYTTQPEYFARPSYDLTRRRSGETSRSLPSGWEQDAKTWCKLASNASAAAVIDFIHLLAQSPITDPEMRQKLINWFLQRWWHFIYTKLNAWHQGFKNDVIMAEAVKVLWPTPPADPGPEPTEADSGERPTEADKVDLIDFAEEPEPAGDKSVAPICTPTPAQVVSQAGLGNVPSPKRTARRKRSAEANPSTVSERKMRGGK